MVMYGTLLASFLKALIEKRRPGAGGEAEDERERDEGGHQEPHGHEGLHVERHDEGGAAHGGVEGAHGERGAVGNERVDR